MTKVIINEISKFREIHPKSLKIKKIPKYVLLCPSSWQKQNNLRLNNLIKKIIKKYFYHNDQFESNKMINKINLILIYFCI